jgi:hypothetical protein
VARSAYIDFVSLRAKNNSKLASAVSIAPRGKKAEPQKKQNNKNLGGMHE